MPGQRRATVRLLWAGVAVPALAAVACAGGVEPVSTVVAVGMRDIAFDPTSITARRGEALRVMLRNSGTQPHDFTISDIAAEDVRSEGGEGHGDHAGEYRMHLLLSAGRSGEVEFRPTAAGEYEFFCTVPGHRDAGMRGTIRVE